MQNTLYHSQTQSLSAATRSFVTADFDGPSLDIGKLEKIKQRPGKIEARCPACAELGQDKQGNHFFVRSSGHFGCVANAGDREHRRRIFELISIKGDQPFRSIPLPRPERRPDPKQENLLQKIQSNFPSSVAAIWERSPVQCDEDLQEARAFLNLFPAKAVLWMAADVHQSGRPEHAFYFQSRTDWQRENLTEPGMRVCPCSFVPGSYARTGANVAEHHFAVIESDTIAQDEFCSVIEWLAGPCGWRLAAVVDSGRRSLHAWFHHPGDDMEDLKECAVALGLDNAFARPAQPWRLPGVLREGSDRRQQLIYLDLGGVL